MSAQQSIFSVSPFAYAAHRQTLVAICARPTNPVGKVSNLNFAEYLALDPRDQASIRDEYADRDRPNKPAPQRNEPIFEIQVFQENQVGDPRTLASIRDRVCRDAQYIELLDESDSLWIAVSQTDQALELDKMLGHAKLTQSEKRALHQRHTDLTALHFKSKRKLAKITRQMVMAF